MLTLKESLLSLAAFWMLVCVPTLVLADDYCPLCMNSSVDPSANDNLVVNVSEPEIFYIGLGLRAVGFVQSPIRLEDDCLEMNVFGGPGYYIKGRINQYLSILFENDFLYGTYKDRDGSMLKASAALGLQGHFLNYGRWDFYAAVSAVATSVFHLSGGNIDEMWPSEVNFWVWGGQFGLGLSYILGDRPATEIGVDVRYVIEQAPDASVFGTVNREHDIHGVIFSLSIGLAA